MEKQFKLPQLALSLPIFVCIVLWCMMLARVLYFYFTSDDLRVSVIPDDTFYYIQLAKHYVAQDGWRFDGNAPTTGFHLLYAYFLVFLYTLFPHLSWASLYLIIGLVATTCLAFAAYWIMKSTAMLFSFQSSLWSIIPFVTVYVLIQSNMMMESWLVIFFLSLGFYRFLSSQKCTRYDQATLIMLGILGSLARSDFGLFPGILWLVYCLSFKKWHQQEVKRSFLWLLGAVLGLIILWLHTYHVSGHVTQASAQIKFYWSSLLGHDIQASWHFLKYLIVPYGQSTDLSFRLKMFMLLVLVLGLFFGRQDIRKNANTWVIVLSVCLITLGYIFFYRFNSSSLQIWYAANYIIPLCILCAAFGTLIQYVPLLKHVSVVITILILTTYFNVAHKGLFMTPWPHQSGMMYAGLSLKEMNLDGKIGAWNAGIISYFSGLPIVNLDGLVNDNIFPYIRQNRLLDYIQKNHIGYVADYEYMLKNTSHRLRGGYADGKLEHCLTSLGAIDGPAEEWPLSPEHSKLQLFKLNGDCADVAYEDVH